MYLDLEMKVISMDFYRKVLKTRESIARLSALGYCGAHRSKPKTSKPQLRIVKNDVHN